MPYICGCRWLSLGPAAAQLSLRMSRAVCDTSSTFRASLPSSNWSRRAARPRLAPVSRFCSRLPRCHWSNTCKCRDKGRLSDILETLHLRNGNRPFQGQVLSNFQSIKISTTIVFYVYSKTKEYKCQQRTHSLFTTPLFFCSFHQEK